jgi:WD40 repeat protein
VIAGWRYSRHLAKPLLVLLLPGLVLVLWQMMAPRPRTAWHAGEEPHLHRFSPDGKTLIVTTRTPVPGAANARRILAWDVETGQLRYTLAESAAGIRSFSFSPDGRLLAAADSQNGRPVLHLWDATAGRSLADFPLDAGLHSGTEFHFVPGGRFLLVQGVCVRPQKPPLVHVSDHQSLVHVWDVQAKRLLATVDGNLRGLVVASDGGAFGSARIARSGDGKSVANDVIVELWQLASGKEPIKLLKRHEVKAARLCLFPDLSVFAYAGFPEKGKSAVVVRVCDLKTGAVRTATVDLQLGHILDFLFFSPDSRFLTVGSLGWGRGQVAVLNVRDLKLVTTYPVYPTFFPDGKWLLVPNGAGIDLDETATFRRRATLRIPGDESDVQALVHGLINWADRDGAFSACGKDIIYSPLRFPRAPDFLKGATRVRAPSPAEREEAPIPPIARLWDADKAHPFTGLRGCSQVVFSADATLLAAVYPGGKIDIWDLPPRKPMRLILGLAAALWVVIVVGTWLVRKLASRPPCQRRAVL